jgi:acetylglutamate/LysW-gamma-L-alpha-aminoadipate kinase
MLVVKLGGGAGIDHAALVADVAALVARGERVILVHGTSRQANELGERLGHPPRFVQSPSGHTSRYTDRQTLDIFMMAAAGLVNTTLVEALQAAGVDALGLTGLDGRLLVGQRKASIRVVEGGKPRVLRDDWTGTIERVNAALLQSLLAAGYVPVVAPLALSHAGEGLNVDGDRAAGAIAVALAADVLVLLTNVPGLLHAFPDERSLVPRIARDALDAWLPVAQGRMKKKLLGAGEALAGGVRRVVLADARRDAPLAAALAGNGTVIE